MALLDTFNWVGDSLDKLGARPLRGVLGGKPREALSFIPFSDRVGITNPKDIVSGRNLTDNAGITEKGDKGFASTAAGVGADLLADPFNFVSGAGLAKHALKGFKGAARADRVSPLARHLTSAGDFSLGLKYDDLAVPPGHLPRHEPEWVNNRTWYHGTATQGLNPGNLDVSKTDPAGLFGRGIYTTDEGGIATKNPSITAGYGRARNSNAEMEWKDAAHDWVSNHPEIETLRHKGDEYEDTIRENHKRILGEQHRNLIPHIQSLIGSNQYNYWKNPELTEGEAHVVLKRIVDTIGQSGRYLTSDFNGAKEAFGDAFDLLFERAKDAADKQFRETYGHSRDVNLFRIQLRDLKPKLFQDYPKLFPKPSPIIYQAKTNFNNILDLNQPAGPITHSALSQAIIDAGYDFPERFEDHTEGQVGDLVKWMARNGVNNQDTSEDLLINALKGQGYDALTHTGGVQGGRKHQVVIGLDPNDAYKTGRMTPYEVWKEFASPLTNDGDFSLTTDPLGTHGTPYFHKSEPVDFGRIEHILRNMGSDARQLPPHPLSPKRHMAVDPWGGDQERDLINKAVAYGPNYPGGVSKLADIVSGLPFGLRSPSERMLQSPLAERLAAEFPEGSKVIGSGAQAFAADNGMGGIVRMSQAIDPIANTAGWSGELGAPNIKEMLQPVRSVDIGPYRVEHLPRVNPIYKGHSDTDAYLSALDRLPSADPARAQVESSFNAIDAGARDVSTGLGGLVSNYGMMPWDVHERNPTNVSLTNEGNAVIHDRGAVWSHDPRGSSGFFSKIAAPPSLEYPTPAESMLLRNMGAPEEVQKAIRLGLERGTAGQGVDLRSVLSPGSDPDALRANMELFRRLTGQFDPTRVNADLSLGGIPASPGLASGAGGLDPRFAELRRMFQMHKGVPLAPHLKPGSIQGIFKPSINAGAVYQGAVNPSRTTRHEVGHGIVANAIKGGAGAIAGLPLAWQPGAWAQYAGGRGSGVGKFGRYLDEIAQHSTENRGFANQLRGGVNFATNRGIAKQYAAHLAADNPLLRALIMAPPFASENRGSLALGALGAADLARISASLQREEQ